MKRLCSDRRLRNFLSCGISHRARAAYFMLTRGKQQNGAGRDIVSYHWLICIIWRTGEGESVHRYMIVATFELNDHALGKKHQAARLPSLGPAIDRGLSKTEAAASVTGIVDA